AEPPRVEFHDGIVEASLKGFHLEGYALDPATGVEKLLLKTVADLHLGVVPEVDPLTNQLNISLDGTQITVDTIQSDVLFSDDPNAEQDLKDFIQGWVVQRMNAQMHDKAVTPTILPAQGYYLMVDGLHP